MDEPTTDDITHRCADCGSTDTMFAGSVMTCTICSRIMCWQCSPKHAHACECCGKAERYDFAERCGTCNKLACRDCLYSHPCSFLFRVRRSSGTLDQMPDFEIEEHAQKLASRLWVAVLAALEASYQAPPMAVGQGSCEIPPAANGPMGLEAMVFVALEAITRAQRVYDDSQLRRFIAILSDRLARCIRLSLLNVPDDKETLTQIKNEFESCLEMRYRQQFLGENNMSLLDRCFRRFYSVTFGRPAWRRSCLTGMINYSVQQNGGSLPDWLRDAFVERVFTESESINEERFRIENGRIVI